MALSKIADAGLDLTAAAIPVLNSSSMPAGSVIQVVTGTHSSSAGSTSTSYSDTGLSATITPSSSSNKILVIVYMPGLYKAATTAGTAVNLQLLRDSTSVLTGSNCYNNASHQQLGIFSASILDMPSTTSATVYKLQFKTNDGNYVLVNTDSDLATITLLEIAA